MAFTRHRREVLTEFLSCFDRILHFFTRHRREVLTVFNSSFIFLNFKYNIHPSPPRGSDGFQQIIHILKYISYETE